MVNPRMSFRGIRLLNSLVMRCDDFARVEEAPAEHQPVITLAYHRAYRDLGKYIEKLEEAAGIK